MTSTNISWLNSLSRPIFIFVELTLFLTAETIREILDQWQEAKLI